MRRLILFLTVLLLMVASLAAVPAVAAETPVGTRVDITTGSPTVLPADTPFHVLHGWGIIPNQATGLGAADFRLDIDGLDQGKGSLQNSGAAGSGAVVKLWLYNFEDGLPPGSYLFTGHWFLPCRPAVDGGLYPGPCEKPNASVEVFTISLAVTFT